MFVSLPFACKSDNRKPLLKNVEEKDVERGRTTRWQQVTSIPPACIQGLAQAGKRERGHRGSAKRWPSQTFPPKRVHRQSCGWHKHSGRDSGRMPGVFHKDHGASTKFIRCREAGWGFWWRPSSRYGKWTQSACDPFRWNDTISNPKGKASSTPCPHLWTMERCHCSVNPPMGNFLQLPHPWGGNMCCPS